MLSLLIVVFDVWGLTIQNTAILGLIIPIIFEIYLLDRRSQLQEMMQ